MARDGASRDGAAIKRGFIGEFTREVAEPAPLRGRRPSALFGEGVVPELQGDVHGRLRVATRESRDRARHQ